MITINTLLFLRSRGKKKKDKENIKMLLVNIKVFLNTTSFKILFLEEILSIFIICFLGFTMASIPYGLSKNGDVII